MTGRRIRQDRIARFNDRHDVSSDQQFLMLIEELGELAEAVHDPTLARYCAFKMSRLGDNAEYTNREGFDIDTDWDKPDETELAEELADIIFVARSLAEVHDINISARVNEVARENLEKDESSDGQKVTKKGLDNPVRK